MLSLLSTFEMLVEHKTKNKVITALQDQENWLPIYKDTEERFEISWWFQINMEFYRDREHPEK